MNDADETGDCVRSVRDSAQAGLTPAVLGGPVRKHQCILEPADDFIGRFIPAYFSPHRETTPRVKYWEKIASNLSRAEHERRFKVAARFSVAGGKIPETLPFMGCIMRRHPNSL